MKNPIIVSLVFALVTIFGIGVYAFSRNSSQSESMITKDEVLISKDESSSEPTGAMMQINDSSTENNDTMTNANVAGSGYVEYSNTAFNNASNNRRVLFFYASWCPTCRPADTSFTKNVSKIPDDVTLIRVNYNDPDTDQEEKDLAKKYGITYQHTFVQIDSTGKEVTKWNGGQIDELLFHVK
jgi:thiol-disulfide isomerase/thioredoxin